MSEVLSRAKIAEIKAKNYAHQSLQPVDIDNLCESHDALDQENERLNRSIDDRIFSHQGLLGAISDLTRQLAQRDKAIAEALKQLECVQHDSGPDRHGDPSCASLRDRGRFRGPCNCGISDVLAALTSTLAAPLPDFDPAAPKGALSIP